jgi:hypothetical protein
MVPWSESPSSMRNNDEEEPGDPEDDKNLLGLPRNWKGLTMVPKKMKRKILEKGLRDFSTEEGEEEEDDSLHYKLYMHICIFLVGDGTFVSFELRQRKIGLAKRVCGSTRLRPATRLGQTQTRPVYINGSGPQTRHDP